MNIVVPFRFYQVRDCDTLESISQKFNVNPEKIERERKEEPLAQGEMLVIRYN